MRAVAKACDHDGIKKVMVETWGGSELESDRVTRKSYVHTNLYRALRVRHSIEV